MGHRPRPRRVCIRQARGRGLVVRPVHLHRAGLSAPGRRSRGVDTHRIGRSVPVGRSRAALRDGASRHRPMVTAVRRPWSDRCHRRHGMDLHDDRCGRLRARHRARTLRLGDPLGSRPRMPSAGVGSRADGLPPRRPDGHGPLSGWFGVRSTEPVGLGRSPVGAGRSHAAVRAPDCRAALGRGAEEVEAVLRSGGGRDGSRRGRPAPEGGGRRAKRGAARHRFRVGGFQWHRRHPAAGAPPPRRVSHRRLFARLRSSWPCSWRGGWRAASVQPCCLRSP